MNKLFSFKILFFPKHLRKETKAAARRNNLKETSIEKKYLNLIMMGNIQAQPAVIWIFEKKKQNLFSFSFLFTVSLSRKKRNERRPNSLSQAVMFIH